MMVTASTSSLFDCSAGINREQLAWISFQHAVKNIKRHPFQNANTLNNATHTESSAVHLPQCVGHASLVAQEGSEVDRMAGIIFGPCAHAAPVPPASLVGQKAHVSMSGGMELPMRLIEGKEHRRET